MKTTLSNSGKLIELFATGRSKGCVALWEYLLLCHWDLPAGDLGGYEWVTNALRARLSRLEDHLAYL